MIYSFYFISKKKQCGTKNDGNDESLKDKTSKKVDQSSLTDESSFGSCEPGTNIVLQGIVWNETDKGKEEKNE